MYNFEIGAEIMNISRNEFFEVSDFGMTMAYPYNMQHNGFLFAIFNTSFIVLRCFLEVSIKFLPPL